MIFLFGMTFEEWFLSIPESRLSSGGFSIVNDKSVWATPQEGIFYGQARSFHRKISTLS
jgi:hypothetical protein